MSSSDLALAEGLGVPAVLGEDFGTEASASSSDADLNLDSSGLSMYSGTRLTANQGLGAPKGAFFFCHLVGSVRSDSFRRTLHPSKRACDECHTVVSFSLAGHVSASHCASLNGFFYLAGKGLHAIPNNQTPALQPQQSDT